MGVRFLYISKTVTQLKYNEMNQTVTKPLQGTMKRHTGESRGSLGPFRATQIWNEVIEHLKANVEVKRRRHKIRHYDNCFTGTDAVDVVLHYLLSDHNTFSPDLSREKATKLCQTLMDKNVFEPVTTRTSEAKKCFDDSHSKLYRFMGAENDIENCPPSQLDSEEEMEEGQEDDFRLERVKVIGPVLGPDLIGETVLCNPIAVNRKGQILQDLFSFENRNKFARRSLYYRHCTGMSSQVLEEIWKETALCQLLTLVDLPFLDGILSEEKIAKKQKQSTVLSNGMAKHWNMPGSRDSGIQDIFMRTALDCIECLPKGPSILEQDFVRRSDPISKMQALSVIVEHYRSLAEPLLPERFLDLNLAILNLVLQEKEEIARDALQLSLILLPWNLREEVQRLLKFMAAAADDSLIQLDPKEDNETMILKTFTDCVLRHKVIAHNLSTVLIQFLMHSVHQVFSIPQKLRSKVELRITELQAGHATVLKEITFCDQVTTDEYIRQSEVCTSEALIDMMNRLLDDTHVHLKEKKQKLRHFQKYHPHLYAKHFSELR
ncbi:hypothetical protein ScPMuIL_013272 [Solemya velum]